MWSVTLNCMLSITIAVCIDWKIACCLLFQMDKTFAWMMLELILKVANHYLLNNLKGSLSK